MYDVIIVGACTAGTYFASLLAERGLKVLVMDKDSEANLAKRLDISRASLYRAFESLEQQKLIRRHGRSITVPNLRALDSPGL